MYKLFIILYFNCFNLNGYGNRGKLWKSQIVSFLGMVQLVLYCNNRKLFSLATVLLPTTGACGTVYWQKLSCPYSELQQQNLLRVWCRQSSSLCCSGFAFSQRVNSVDGSKLRVTQSLDSFTVAVWKLSQGSGVYWCGVLSKNDTIIKLAEGYFHSCKKIRIKCWQTGNLFKSYANLDMGCRLCKI